jgi:predicted flap endonuclease-1-like 5' DNA nuclease
MNDTDILMKELKAGWRRISRKPMNPRKRDRGAHGALKALQIIPGVGPSLAQDLVDLGFSDVDELKGQDAERMYQDLCRIRGGRVDRCVLYVFRCAVYYASNSDHDPELLKWWNWKDKK